jgi:hypothetical protein
VATDDIMGRFAVATADKPVSQLVAANGERVVCRVMSREAADHTVSQHNEWLESNPAPEVPSTPAG